MSGGSYNYAGYSDPWSVCEQDIEAMIKTMRREGYNKAADKVNEYLNKIREYKKQLAYAHDSVTALMVSFEWYVSGDTCKEHLDEELKKMGYYK